MNRVQIRNIRSVGLLTIAALLAGAGANAQTWPTKTIRIVVPFAPGGVLDGLIRPLSQNLTELLGQPVILENRPGGNGMVGMGLCAQGAPDGYSICAAGPGVVLNPMLYKNIPYAPEKDLAPVAKLVQWESLMAIHPSVPANTLKELIAYARANPGKLNFGSYGSASAAHLTLEWIKNRTGVDIV
ncbi:MAG: Bug family tripartite tricarboxylate transporter substrate binding protein, partial [Burkholderiales bacterium]